MMSVYYGDKDKGVHLDQRIESFLEIYGVDRGGTMIDVGAYHPTYMSNSYYFESVKGFKVICVEANPAMAELLRATRKIVVRCLASDRSNDVLEFHVVKGDYDAYGYGGSGVHTFEGVRGQTTAVTATSIKRIPVMTRTLNDILSEHGVETLDAMSIDVEGHELEVLKGLDLGRYRPKVCCIENYFNEPWLEKYMRSNGYRKSGRLHCDDFYVLPINSRCPSKACLRTDSA